MITNPFSDNSISFSARQIVAFLFRFESRNLDSPNFHWRHFLKEEKNVSSVCVYLLGSKWGSYFWWNLNMDHSISISPLKPELLFQRYLKVYFYWPFFIEDTGSISTFSLDLWTLILKKSWEFGINRYSQWILGF